MYSDIVNIRYDEHNNIKANQPHKMILLCGKSGTGKSTISQALESQLMYGFKSIKSYTTRKPRYPNEDGHIFLTPDQFDQIRADIVGYTKFDSNEYGTTTQQINSHNIYVIDPDGIDYLKQQYHGDTQFIVIGLWIPWSVTVMRMYRRGDSILSIMKRLRNDRKKFKNMNKTVDYILPNFDTSETIHRILNIWDGENS